METAGNAENLSRKGRSRSNHAETLKTAAANVVHEKPGLAGVGLAGELGVGVAIISEVMTPQRRGVGTMIIAGCGVLGSTAAGYFGTHLYWRHSFMLGGCMGLVLLLLRLSVSESEMFRRAIQKPIVRGSLLMLLGSRKRLARYALCVGVGLPIYVVMGLLLTGAPELGLALGLPVAPVAGTAILVGHLSMLAGDMTCTAASQLLRSRRMAFLIFHTILLLGMIAYLYLPPKGLGAFYGRYAMVGFGCGFWVLVTINAAEQFGTNLRATVATSVPNLVRGMLIPITLFYGLFRPSLGLVHAAGLIGIGCVTAALISTLLLPEKFGRDLDYVES